MRIIEKIIIKKWDETTVVYEINYHVLGWANRRNRKQSEEVTIEASSDLIPITIDDKQYVLQKKNTEFVVTFIVDGSDVDGVRSTNDTHEAYLLPTGIEYKRHKNTKKKKSDTTDKPKKKAVKKKKSVE